MTDSADETFVDLLTTLGFYSNSSVFKRLGFFVCLNFLAETFGNSNLDLSLSIFYY